MQLCMTSRIESCIRALETRRIVANVSYSIIPRFDPHPLVVGLFFVINFEYLNARSTEDPHTGANPRSQRPVAPPKQ